MAAQHAIWVPGWYELDPILEVGLTGEFLFRRDVPERFRGQLVLHAGLREPEAMLVATGTISGIEHPVLGAIQKVDTRGLDYTFVLGSGREVCVNAEENPGQAFERLGSVWTALSLAIDDWQCVVTFSDLSALTQPKGRR